MDKKGFSINPFEQKPDITKMTDLAKVTKQSQKINVQSPRFISTLQRALEKLFSEADKPAQESKTVWEENKPGELNYAQFYESFKDLPYDLTANDMRMLLAIADESPNGAIDWKEFIPVGIDAIKTFLARNKLMAKDGKLFNKELDVVTMAMIYEAACSKAAQFLTRKFKKVDYNIETKKHSGFVTFKFM